MTRGERVYRALLRLALPADVSEDDREDLVAAFRWFRRRARQAGPLGRWSFWPRMVADAAWTGLRVRSGGRNPAVGVVGHAWRSLTRRPAHAVVVTLTLGLGVGAGTAVGVLARDVLLRPLPFADPERLVRLREADEDRRPWWPSRLNFEDWRAAGAPGVLGIEAVSAPEPRPVLTPSGPVRADVVEVSSGFFDLVGAAFVAGRPPSAAEWAAGGVPGAVVSHAFWRGPLGGASIPGPEIEAGAERFPVVGVLEPGFGFLADGGAWGAPDVWIAMERTPAPAVGRQNHGIHVVARLGPGVSMARGDEGLDAMAARVRSVHGQATHAHSVLTTSLADDLLGAARRSLALLLVAALGVLAVAGLNLAGTLFVDGLGRRRELAVRRALGAGHRRIVGQLVAEASLAALPAAAVGWGVAWAGLEVVRRLDPGALPRLDAVAVDGGVFLAAVLAGTGVAVAAAALPGLFLAGAGSVGRVAAGFRGGADRGLRRAWNAVLVVQVGLTLALLIATAGLLRDLATTLRADLGFETEGVALLQVSLPESRYPDSASRVAYHLAALRLLRGLPGVGAASVADVAPHVTQARISGTTDPDVESDAWLWAGLRFVDPDYFDVLGIPLLRGALPAPEAGAAVVDRTVADAILTGEALGRRVRSGMTGGPVTVSGLVGPVREWTVDAGRIGMIYQDFRSSPSGLGDAYFVARGDAGRLPPLAALRTRLVGLDGQVPVTVERLDVAMGRTLGARRLVLAVTGAFGLLGLTFAAMGVYGVVAFVVRRRAREAAVRMALGARAGAVRLGALREGLVPTAFGVALGLGLAAAGGSAAAARVQDLDAAGGPAFAAATVVLLVVAVVASWIPARRTTRVDLVSVLREE